MARKNVRSAESTNSLRTVPPERAFRFYREVGQPLDATSKSLDEFAAIVESVDPASIKFHIERGDFESWFRMLGDRLLADQVAALRGKDISPGELRGTLSSTVKARVDRLHRISSSK
ncbi:MAG TPA: hypothetical protein VMS77_01430 [Conexivisphaerales archaeon]|nr:hypothetical protein [Conexivisphaerales archaeon]